MGWGGIFSAHSAIESDFSVNNTLPDHLRTLNPTFEWNYLETHCCSI